PKGHSVILLGHFSGGGDQAKPVTKGDSRQSLLGPADTFQSNRAPCFTSRRVRRATPEASCSNRDALRPSEPLGKSRSGDFCPRWQGRPAQRTPPQPELQQQTPLRLSLIST